MPSKQIRPNKLPTVEIAPSEHPTKIYQALQDAGFTKSHAEGRRLIQGRGVRLNNDVVTDIEATLSTNDLPNKSVLRVGRKRAVNLSFLEAAEIEIEEAVEKSNESK